MKYLENILLHGLEIQNPHNIFHTPGKVPLSFMSDSLSLAHCPEFVRNRVVWIKNMCFEGKIWALPIWGTTPPSIPSVSMCTQLTCLRSFSAPSSFWRFLHRSTIQKRDRDRAAHGKVLMAFTVLLEAAPLASPWTFRLWPHRFVYY